MTSKHRSTTTGRAGNTIGIHIRPRDTRRPTHPNRILLTRRRLVCIIPTARARAKEQIIITRRAAEVDETGLFRMVCGGVIGDIERRARGCSGRAFHGDFVNVVPEGAERHVVVAAGIGKDCRVDGVVEFGRVGGDAGGAVVGPGAYFHGGGGCVADSRVLRAECADGVVHVVR